MSVLTDGTRGPPVFILGLHRSGTTWLYEMLARGGRFDVLTACHIICFDEYLSGRTDPALLRDQLGKRFEQMGLTNRGGEAVCLTPDTPEEYGFVLDNRSAGPRLTRKNFSLFRQIGRMVRKGTDTKRRLLVKNPWDFANGRLIKELLPDAKFVFIHRNPFHVLSSMYKLSVSSVTAPDPYTAMLHRRYRRLKDSRFQRRVANCVLECAPGLVVRALLMWVRRSAGGYLSSLSAIPPADRIDVNYETLCQETNPSMARILSHLGVKASKCDYSRSVAVRAAGVLAPVAAARSRVVREVGDYAAAVGYDLQALSRDL